MSKFNIIKSPIEGLVVIEPTVFGDNRGFFMESYSKRDFEEAGIVEEFVQDNHSKSKKGVLRGLHFQTKNPQGKLIRVVSGSVYDVAVDLRVESETFGQSYGVILSADNKRQFYVPPRFAHGFLTLEENTEFLYKCTDYYSPQYDGGIHWSSVEWNFKQLDINENELILSEKDRVQPLIKTIKWDEIF